MVHRQRRGSEVMAQSGGGGFYGYVGNVVDPNLVEVGGNKVLYYVGMRRKVVLGSLSFGGRVSLHDV